MQSVTLNHMLTYYSLLLPIWQTCKGSWRSESCVLASKSRYKYFKHTPRASGGLRDLAEEKCIDICIGNFPLSEHTQ